MPDNASKGTKLPLRGIRIVETEQNHFLLMIGTRQPHDLFVTTPTLREAIRKGKLQDTQIGFISLTVSPGEQSIRTYEYYPFQQPQGTWLHRKGIATLVELQIEKLMHRRFPDYSILSGNTTLFGRQLQIIKRGRTPGVPIPIQEAIKLTRAKAISDYQKARKKNAHSFKQRLIGAIVRGIKLFRRRK